MLELIRTHKNNLLNKFRALGLDFLQVSTVKNQFKQICLIAACVWSVASMSAAFDMSGTQLNRLQLINGANTCTLTQYDVGSNRMVLAGLEIPKAGGYSPYYAGGTFWVQAIRQVSNPIREQQMLYCFSDYTANTLVQKGTDPIGYSAQTFLGFGYMSSTPGVGWVEYIVGNGTLAPTATTSAAPTIGAATPGNGQVSVVFTAPTNTGGAAITGYTVTSNPGGFTGTGAASPIIVTGLANGTAYTFTVTATNSAGSSAASSASSSVTPGLSQAITFANPGSQNFGTTPTLTATSDSQLIVSFSSSTPGVCTITSGGALSIVSVGSCTIDADQAGDSSYAAATTVSQTFTTNAVAADAPAIGAATPGNAQVSVAFTAPTNTGGAAITNYEYSSDGGTSWTAFNPATTASPVTISNLTNGTSYSIALRGVNSVGSGTASSTRSVTPATTSAAPTIGTVTPSAGQVSVAFTAPANTGGENGNAKVSHGSGVIISLRAT